MSIRVLVADDQSMVRAGFRMLLAGEGDIDVVAEAGTGLAFLALVIGYIPVLYQSFSRREIYVTLLDARAGSPPSAGSLLRRYALSDQRDIMNQFLREWEFWAAEILESHLSYPILMYYRSQHERQSWLAGLTVILDTTALILVGVVLSDGVTFVIGALLLGFGRKESAVDAEADLAAAKETTASNTAASKKA